MATEVEAPDGSIVEFPDGTPASTMKLAMQKKYPPQPKQGLGEALLDPVHGFNRGLANIVSAPYRAVDWLGEKVTGTGFLPDVDKMPYWKDYLNPPAAQSVTGRLLQSAGDAVGSAILPMGVLAGRASQLTAAAPTTTTQRVVQSIAQPYANAPMAAAGVDLASAAASGIGAGAAREAEAGPVGEFVGGMAGGLAPFAAASGYRQATQGLKESVARQGQTGAYAHVADALDGSVDDFATRAATGSTTHRAGRQREVFDILGEEMQRSGGQQAPALQQTVDRLVREQGMAPSTAQTQVRSLLRTHRDSPLFLGEYDAVANANASTRMARNPANVAVDDASRINNTRTQDLFDYTANTGGTAAARTTRNAVDERQAGLRGYLRTSLDRMMPGNARSLEDAEALLNTARTQADQAYRAAYTGPQNQPRLVNGIEVAMRNATRRLGSRGGEHAQLIREVIDEFQPIVAAATANQPQLRGTITNLQAAQDGRTAVRGRMEAARNAGRNDLAGTLRPIYDDLTRALSYASPAWGRANRMWGDMTTGERALEFGQRFIERSSIDQRRAIRDFHRMAPAAQDLVRVGWLQKQYDKMAEIRDTHDASKLFDKDGMYRQIEHLFGRADMLTFARAVRDAEVANKSKGMIGNSATHRRGEMQKRMDIDPGIGAAVELTSIRGVREWLVRKMLDALKSGRDDVLAGVITTPMQSMPDVAQHVHNMRRAQQQMQTLRHQPDTVRPAIGASFGLYGALDNQNENALAGENRGR